MEKCCHRTGKRIKLKPGRAQLQNIAKTFNNRKQYLEKILRFFFITRQLSYPVETYNDGNELVPAVFLVLSLTRRKRIPMLHLP